MSFIRQAALRRLLALGLLLCAGIGAGVRAEIQTLDQAQVYWRAEPGLVEDVRLPYFYQADSPAHSGVADFVLTFDLPAGPPGALPYAIFLPVMGGNARLLINGRELERFGMEDGIVFRQTRVPQAVAIPHALLDTRNELVVRLEGGRAVRGVPDIQVGPYEEIMPLLASENLIHVGGRYAAGTFALLVALISLGLWWTQLRVQADGSQRRERFYLYGALAQLAWTVRVAEPMIESFPIATDWRLVISGLGFGIWTTCMTLQCVELSAWDPAGHTRWLRRWLGLQLLLGLVMAVQAWVWHRAGQLTFWYLLNLATVASFSVVFAGHAWRARLPRSIRFLAAAVVLNVVAGAVDLFQVRYLRDYSAFQWLYPTSMLLGLAVMIVAVQRFRDARLQADELSRSLEQRVRQREAELLQAQQQMAELLQDQARQAERNRILKNMHDGVGSHLSQAIHQLAHGSSDTAVVLDTLREGMDHLKLSVDMASIETGDVVGLLCSLRHRLEPRLAGAGIRLVWDVAEFEPPAAWAKRDLSPLLYVLYEIVSNVLQHAHASELQVHCSRSGEEVLLRLQDNGVGFTPKDEPGRGLRIIRSRLAEMGAQVAWQGTPGGTAVTITLGPALSAGQSTA